ncbi:hypothetical protein [Streptomyces sp. NPDC005968]|uniref:hypothetical protein n=1 Tax=Streptomyces sp. NPDC005968 TaxID=3154574 RepID=UPI0033D9D6C9
MTFGLGVIRSAPSPKGLRDLRRRVGCAPMKALFEVVAGVLAQPRTPGVRFGPYRTVSFDGCGSIKTPDSERNRGWLGRCPHGGYPQIELMTLVETGTRAVIAAFFGPTREGETSYAAGCWSTWAPTCSCCGTAASTATTSSPPSTPPALVSWAASVSVAARRFSRRSATPRTTP